MTSQMVLFLHHRVLSLVGASHLKNHERRTLFFFSLFKVLKSSHGHDKTSRYTVGKKQREGSSRVTISHWIGLQ